MLFLGPKSGDFGYGGFGHGERPKSGDFGYEEVGCGEVGYERWGGPKSGDFGYGEVGDEGFGGGDFGYGGMMISGVSRFHSEPFCQGNALVHADEVVELGERHEVVVAAGQGSFPSELSEDGLEGLGRRG